VINAEIFVKVMKVSALGELTQAMNEGEVSPRSARRSRTSSPGRSRLVSLAQRSNYSKQTKNQNGDSDRGSDRPPLISEQTSRANTWRKFKAYGLEVDAEQDDKGTEILLCSMKRPHMRAFHCNWICFFAAFFSWFAVTPLLSTIQEDLGLSAGQVWTSTIATVGSTVFFRILVGPLCDMYGPRVVFAVLLCVSAIPVACVGLVHSAHDLILVRMFIGIVGASFVPCQFWTSRMFTKELVGTANGLVAGWGNLGAGVTQIIVGSWLFPLLTMIYGGNRELAWRTVCIVPAIIAFAVGCVTYAVTDDAPKGNYRELKAHGLLRPVNPWKSLWRAASNTNTWIFFLQYAGCFGVEITMNNASAMYFRDNFGLSTEAAAAMTSIFGWLNLFARGLGGFLCDVCNYRWGMRGRLWSNAISLFCEGMMLLAFINTGSLGGAIVALVAFSLFVQASEGFNFGIVPYIDPLNMGAVTGIVGAGGNVGAVLFAYCFRELSYERAFQIMGAVTLISAFSSLFVRIKGYSGMLFGVDRRVNRETGLLISGSDSGSKASDASPKS
jgi:MFS transporter, NNP family, nitrate/nitrite transporter